jgi:hypothetical protein
VIISSRCEFVRYVNFFRLYAFVFYDTLSSIPIDLNNLLEFIDSDTSKVNGDSGKFHLFKCEESCLL